MQQQQPGPATDAGLAMLVDQDDTPLFLGAIHRVLGRTTLAALQDAAERAGIRWQSVDPAHALGRLAPDRLVATDGTDWLTLQVDVRADRAAVEVTARGPDPVPRYRTQLDRAPSRGRRGVGCSRRAKTSVAILMPAPSFEQVLSIAAADRLLPEKATSFQPKPSVGVLIRALPDG